MTLVCVQVEQLLDAATVVLQIAQQPPIKPQQQQQQQPRNNRTSVSSSISKAAGEGWDDEWADIESEIASEAEDTESEFQEALSTVGSSSSLDQLAQSVLEQQPVWWQQQREACARVERELAALRGSVRAARLLTKVGLPTTLAELQQMSGQELLDKIRSLLGKALRWVAAVSLVTGAWEQLRWGFGK